MAFDQYVTKTGAWRSINCGVGWVLYALKKFLHIFQYLWFLQHIRKRELAIHSLLLLRLTRLTLLCTQRRRSPWPSYLLLSLRLLLPAHRHLSLPLPSLANRLFLPVGIQWALESLDKGKPSILSLACSRTTSTWMNRRLSMDACRCLPGLESGPPMLWVESCDLRIERFRIPFELWYYSCHVWKSPFPLLWHSAGIS